jgi:hypothetical protein
MRIAGTLGVDAGIIGKWEAAVANNEQAIDFFSALSKVSLSN